MRWIDFRPEGIPMDTVPHATGDTVPLEAALCTEELQRRPSRPPDYQPENRALVTLA
jgi:hypothetical protein